MTAKPESFGRKARQAARGWWQRQRAVGRSLIDRAEELYGENATTQEAALPEIVATEGLIQMYRTHAGLRKTVLTPHIWFQKKVVICNGSLPAPDEALPPHVAYVKETVARKFIGFVDGVFIGPEMVSIEMQEEKPDKVPAGVCTMLARSMFMAYPSLQTVRLEIDSQALERALDRTVISRSSLEPPAGPAPAT